MDKKLKSIAVSFSKVYKYYKSSNVVAVDNLSFEIYENEILGIVGDNGAGKTTLMRILAGLEVDYSGDIEVFSKKVYINNVSFAKSLGISIVPQNDELIDEFNTIENVILSENRGHILLNSTKVAAELHRLVKKYGFQIDIHKKIKHLDRTKKKCVAILKALYNKSKIIILDEPTALMGENDSRILYNAIKSLNAENTTIVIITHRIKDLISINARIAFMNKGRIEKVYSDISKFKSMHTEIKLNNNIENKYESERKKIVELENVCFNDNKSHELKNISFNSYEGEILAITAKEGNGLSELEDILSGFKSINSGKIFLRDDDVSKADTIHLRKKKLAYIPADRIKRGGSIYSKVSENIIINKRDAFSHFGFFDNYAIKNYTNMILEQFQVNTKYSNMFSTLSGGNMQRIILSRELKQVKDYIIISSPSNGLDKRYTTLTHQKIMDLKNAKISVILLSYDISEILKLSDRILILRKGEIVKEVINNQYTREEDIYNYMAGTIET